MTVHYQIALNILVRMDKSRVSIEQIVLKLLTEGYSLQKHHVARNLVAREIDYATGTDRGALLDVQTLLSLARKESTP